VISRVLIALVRGYQKIISPLLGHNCRFTPTCSQYMIQAIQVHGPAKGLLLGLWRILRCNSFCMCCMRRLCVKIPSEHIFK